MPYSLLINTIPIWGFLGSQFVMFHSSTAWITIYLHFHPAIYKVINNNITERKKFRQKSFMLHGFWDISGHEIFTESNNEIDTAYLKGGATG